MDGGVLRPLILTALLALPTASSAADGPAVDAVAVPALGLSLEPPEQIVRFRDRRRDAGVDGPAAELACRPFAEALSLCFTWQGEDGRHYVTQADLGAWGLTLDAVEERVRRRAAEALNEHRPERTAVTDMDASYWLSMEGDGLDESGWLLPDSLHRLLGPGLRVAVPARDIFIAWAPGSEELDKVMAVGVLRIHQASDHPVTSRVYTWDLQGRGWKVWGQVR